MAKKKGRLMLVNIGDGATPTETFDTLCALTSKTLTINNEEIDVTTPDCTTPGGVMWTEVLDGAKRVSVSGSGMSKKEDSEARLADVAMDGDGPFANLQIVVPNFGTFAGRFFIQSSGFAGDATGGATFEFSAASSGAVTFTAEA
jgi:TP901-1 family phage major tail protein